MNNQLEPKKIAVTILFILLYLISTAASYLYFTFSKVVVERPEAQLAQPLSSTSDFDLSALPRSVPGAYGVLLLGYGGSGHEGGNLTDSMTVVYINSEHKQVVLISIPRDIWLAIPVSADSTENRKINAAYVVGGGELAKRTASMVIGIPIQHFVAVSFDGFKEAIDILEGVEVDVPKTFDDYYFPVKGLENEICGKNPEEVEEILTRLTGFEIDKQFPCRFEHIHFDAGKQLMDGETALKFVRSRHSAQHGGDFARSERQHSLLLGIKEKLLSLGVIDDAIPFFNQLSHALRTDLDGEAIETIIDALGGESEYSYSTITLREENALVSTTASNGQFILIPKEGVGKWKKVQMYIKEQIEMSLEN